MQFRLIASLFFITSLFLHAQSDTSTLLDGIQIRNIGPAGMSGRVTAIDVERQAPENILIGSASGGVWRSQNGGVSWQPIFDDQPSLSIGAVKIDPNNADVIWVGTGEGNPRNSHNSGKGIYKSIDGGKTWTLLGLEQTKLIHRILIDPTDGNTVYVGAMGSAWGDSENRGVFKTTDGGKTWSKILYVDKMTGVGEMVMDPSNPNKLLVSMWSFRRTPWDFVSGGQGSGLYLTYDGGTSWKKMTKKDGIPDGELGRMGLAFSTNKPEIVYALIEAEKNGFYKSIDGGHTWSLVSSENIGNRPFYYAEIYVDPKNENRIYNLWSYVSKSEDGGRTFQNIMDYGNSIHPDHHAFYIHPDNPSFLINGNDGGLNISYDAGESWTFAGNLPIGQFYHINYDTSFPYQIYGGMQDNGSWVGPSTVFRRGGIRNDDWRELYFGDGFDVVPIVSDSRYGYAMSQGGNVAIYDQVTGHNNYIQPVHPDGEKLRFSWNAAIAADPFDPNGVYFGSQYVHYSHDRGKNWKIISDDLTTNDSTKQNQNKSGGLTPDVTLAENHTTILCIAPSPMEHDIIWVGTDDGQLQLTRDGGKSWNLLSSHLPNFQAGSWIPQIEIGQKEGEAFVVVNDYRRNNWSAQLYHTDNYGRTFRQIVNDEDVSSFVCSVVQDYEDPNLLFLGADDGLYYSQNKGETWRKWHESFPSVQVRDLKIHPITSDLIIGTFGRSIWVLDDIGFLRNQKDLTELNDKFKVLHCEKSATRVSMASYQGTRFYAQGEFVAPSSRRGLAVTYFSQGNEKESEKEEEAEQKEDEDESNGKRNKKDKAKVYVLSANGDTIRNFTFKPKEGINRVHWDMRKNGVRLPSRNKHKEDADPPRGRNAAPGEYLLLVDYNSNVDSFQIRILDDPRSEFIIDWSAVDTIIGRYENLVEKVNVAFEQIRQMKEGVNLVKSNLANASEEDQKKVKKQLKKLNESLQNIEDEFVGKSDVKGITDRSFPLNSKLGQLSTYCQAAEGVEGSNLTSYYNYARGLSNDLIQKVNDFKSVEWQQFEELMKEVETPMFKKMDKLEKID